MTTIQIRAPHVSSTNVAEDVAAVIAGNALTDNGELTAASAVTIASWYQSPGTIGRVLAAFASGRAVDHTALLDDISATARQAMGRTSDGWPVELELLSTFVVNFDAEAVQE